MAYDIGGGYTVHGTKMFNGEKYFIKGIRHSKETMEKFKEELKKDGYKVRTISYMVEHSKSYEVYARKSR